MQAALPSAKETIQPEIFCHVSRIPRLKRLIVAKNLRNQFISAGAAQAKIRFTRATMPGHTPWVSEAKVKDAHAMQSP